MKLLNALAISVAMFVNKQLRQRTHDPRSHFVSQISTTSSDWTSSS